MRNVRTGEAVSFSRKRVRENPWRRQEPWSGARTPASDQLSAVVRPPSRPPGSARWNEQDVPPPGSLNGGRGGTRRQGGASRKPRGQAALWPPAPDTLWWATQPRAFPEPSSADRSRAQDTSPENSVTPPQSHRRGLYKRSSPTIS